MENELASDPTQRRQLSTLSANRELGTNARRDDTGIQPWTFPPGDELVVEGPAAREPEKSLNAITATAQTAATEANRSQSPLCLCKTPPHIYHPMFRLHRRGMAPETFVGLAGRLVQMDWDDRKLGNPEPNTVNSTRWAIRVVISELGREAARYRWQCGCP